MSRFEKLNGRVGTWAKSIGILAKEGVSGKATPLTQLDKTIEEVLELREALVAQNNNLDHYINSKGILVNTQEQIKDGIGDIDVTIKIQAKMQNLDPLDCLEYVVDIIEKRTGKMINGTFVKDK
jgi:flagellin-like hook-associated protein FlgL